MPEPHVLLLVGTGLVGVALTSRRKRRQQQQGSGMSSIVLNTSNGPMNLLGLNYA